jgi:predicted DNA-binding transcriptional regulator AlpA
VIDMKPRGSTGRLAGVGEIAALLGVSRARAYTISRDFSFPAPYDVLNVDGGRPQAVWLMKDIRAWHRANATIGRNDPAVE